MKLLFLVLLIVFSYSPYSESFVGCDNSGSCTFRNHFVYRKRTDRKVNLLAAIKSRKNYDPYLTQDRRINPHNKFSLKRVTGPNAISMVELAYQGRFEDAVNEFFKLFNHLNEDHSKLQSPEQNKKLIKRPSKLNIITCNQLLKALGSNGKMELCDKIFQSLLRSTSPELQPTLVTYSTLISRCATWKRPHQAQAYFDLLIANGLTPDDVTFNALINAYVKVNDMKTALDSFRMMLQSGIAPTISTVNTLLDGFGKIGLIEAGNNLFLKFSPPLQPDQHTYASLIYGYSQIMELKRAEYYLHQMIDHGYDHCIEGYSCLIHAYGKKGNLAEAYRFYELLRRHGNTPNRVIVTTLINAGGNNGDLSFAIQLYQMMLQSNDTNLFPNSVTCNSLIDICLKAGAVKEAINILRDMKTYSIPLTAITYTTIISHIGKMQGQDDIESLVVWLTNTTDVYVEGVIEKTNPIQTGPIISASFPSELDQLDRLDRIYQEMKKQQIFIDTGFYNTLINSYSEGGFIEKGLGILSTMRREGIEPDIITYTALIKACCRAKAGPKSRDLGDAIFEEMIQRTNHFTNYIQPNNVTFQTLFQLHFDESLTIEEILLPRIYSLCLHLKRSNVDLPVKVVKNAVRVAQQQKKVILAIAFLELLRESFLLPLLMDILKQNATQSYVGSLDTWLVHKRTKPTNATSIAPFLIHSRSWEIVSSLLRDSESNSHQDIYQDARSIPQFPVPLSKRILSEILKILSKEIKVYGIFFHKKIK